MNLRNIPLMIALATLPVTALAASNYLTGRQAAVQPAIVLKGQPRGATVSSNNEQYQLLPGVRATTSLTQEQPQQTLARVGGNAVVETKGNFVVYSTAQQGASVAQSGNVTTYPTVLNPRTGGVGILLGTVNVKLKNMGNAAAVGTDNGLELVREFTHLQLATYRAKPGQDIVAAVVALTADSRVLSAEVEVLENINVPH